MCSARNLSGQDVVKLSLYRKKIIANLRLPEDLEFIIRLDDVSSGLRKQAFMPGDLDKVTQDLQLKLINVLYSSQRYEIDFSLKMR